MRENWRVVLAAVILLVIGTGNYPNIKFTCLDVITHVSNFTYNMFSVLLSLAIIVELTPDSDYHPIAFFIAGFICFIPGAYHVVYIYLAASGHPGYSFYSLSLFN